MLFGAITCNLAPGQILNARCAPFCANALPTHINDNKAGLGPADHRGENAHRLPELRADIAVPPIHCGVGTCLQFVNPFTVPGDGISPRPAATYDVDSKPGAFD